jgi:hypothetical protein
VGLLVWGVAADAVGLRTTTVVAGGLLVVATGVFALTGRFRVMAVDARSSGSPGVGESSAGRAAQPGATPER